MAKYSRVPQQRRTVEFTTPAPYKGLNDVQPLSPADPAYSLIQDNWLAKPSGPEIRQGSKAHVTGFDNAVTSFLIYNGRSASDSRMFAVAYDSIFNVTSSGTLGAAVVTGLNTTNVYWQYTQQTYTASSANYLIAGNGADAPRIYNGSWTTCTQVASPASPGEFSTTDQAGNAVDITKFNDFIVHQQRVWATYNDSTKAYYSNIGQVGGQIYAFDFGSFFARGGALHKLASWTLDGGGTTGINAMLVAISTKGDVVLFRGTDPSRASAWELAGTYQLGAPVGKRCTLSHEGDLLYLSQDGLYPLSRYLKSGRGDDTAALTYPITKTISDLISLYGSLPGFELASCPAENLLLINIPQPGNTTNHQYVMDTIANAARGGGWSRVIGWPARCFAVFNDRLYFGTNTKVMTSFYGGFTDNADVSGAGGSPIVGNIMSAFDTFAAQNLDAATKTIIGVKPFFTISSTVASISVGINTNFEVGNPNTSTIVPPPPVAGGLWDGGLWDHATWTDASPFGSAYSQWFSPFGAPGVHVALMITVTAAGRVTWGSSHWRVKGTYEQ